MWADNQSIKESRVGVDSRASGRAVNTRVGGELTCLATAETTQQSFDRILAACTVATIMCMMRMHARIRFLECDCI